MYQDIEGYWDATPEWREDYKEALKELDFLYPCALALPKELTPEEVNRIEQELAQGASRLQEQLGQYQNPYGYGLQNMYNQQQYQQNMQSQNMQSLSTLFGGPR